MLTLVLVTEGVPSDHDGLVPGGHQAGDVLAEDGLTEDGATENVADGAVGGLPHGLELELNHTLLVGGDRGALDSNIVLLDGIGSINGHLVVGGITVLNT